MVVVVVVAMPRNEMLSDDYIGYVQKTLSLAESNENNVSHRISINDLDVENDEFYYIEVFVPRGPEGEEFVCDFSGECQDNKISLPKPEIKKNDLLVPGRTIKLYVYETPNDETKSDDSGIEALEGKVLARTSAVLDKSCARNVHSSVFSKQAVKHIEEKDINKIKFRNLRTGKEAVCQPKIKVDKDNGSYRIEFPQNVREELDTKPKDLLEIIDPSLGENNVEELIREMHGMMMEMYNDYLEQKDE